MQITKQELRDFAAQIGVDLIGFAARDRFADVPAEINPFSIAPEAKTVIVMGKRITRGTLRGTEEVREFGRRTDHFAGNAGHAEQCAKHLSRLSDDDAYDLQNLIFDKPEQVRRIALVYLLSAAAVVSLLLSFLYPLLLLLFLAVFAANM